VHDQRVVRGCPASGKFENWFFGDVQSGFDQVCQDKLMTLVYSRWPFMRMSQRFSDQPGVTVTIKDYGKTESAIPFYEAFFAFLETHGYTRNVNIRVAGYDSRLTPDMGDFLQRTVKLIEQTYADNGNTPVHLVGHSNGPLYAQYLLTQTSQSLEGQVHPRDHSSGWELGGLRVHVCLPVRRLQRERRQLSGRYGERNEQCSDVSESSLNLYERG
jgi:lecithin-cholesterol acyltransferase